MYKKRKKMKFLLLITLMPITILAVELPQLFLGEYGKLYQSIKVKEESISIKLYKQHQITAEITWSPLWLELTGKNPKISCYDDHCLLTLYNDDEPPHIVPISNLWARCLKDVCQKRGIDTK